jgi:hypothetical protein
MQVSAHWPFRLDLPHDCPTPNPSQPVPRPHGNEVFPSARTPTLVTVIFHRSGIPVKLRSSKYLNNLIEQDHRGVKQRIATMLGFKGFATAAITIAGIELMHRIRKGQFGLGRLGVQGRLAPAVWNAVLQA